MRTQTRNRASSKACGKDRLEGCGNYRGIDPQRAAISVAPPATINSGIRTSATDPLAHAAPARGWQQQVAIAAQVAPASAEGLPLPPPAMIEASALVAVLLHPEHPISHRSHASRGVHRFTRLPRAGMSLRPHRMDWVPRSQAESVTRGLDDDLATRNITSVPWLE
jgi:hypothetical protein